MLRSIRIGFSSGRIVLMDKFFVELEELLTKYYGTDWYYKFDVEDYIQISLSIPHQIEEGENEVSS